MRLASALIAGFVFLLAASPGLAQDLTGLWDVQIQCPGGGIGFGLELKNDSNQWSGFLINGPERIKIPVVKVENQNVQLKIDHYDSNVDLRFSANDFGVSAVGKWKKRRGLEKWVEMDCSAARHHDVDFEPCEKYVGRWAVNFKSSDDPAVGIFNQVKGSNRVLGTFLTSTGDYRFLDGGVKDGMLTLSCFDGAHAFLFQAKLDSERTLKGDFWSSNTWHETWTAKLDQTAALPDEFKQTSINQNVDLGALSFPDLDGKPTRLDDPKFAGKARIIYVFGSWCPNCHDAGAYFSQLQKQYGPKGLSILGLAFEMTGDFPRDAEQVKKYLKRSGTTYPVLVAGLSDKSEATKAFPVLDRVRSYPTTIFIDRDGNVISVHTGFTGPATGDAYRNLKREFERLIDTMLDEK